jgi:hypothetical protein
MQGNNDFLNGCAALVDGILDFSMENDGKPRGPHSGTLHGHLC